MAYKSCAAKIAASIQQDCNKPLVGGYTGRAVILSVLDFERAEVVRSATNPRKILSIVLPPDGSVIAYMVDNVFAQPFAGSTTAGNSDDGRNGYLKTVNVRVPMRGADTSMEVIEPLVKDPNGFVMILEKRDKVSDGSYEVIGYQNALRGNIAGVTRDESANGGDWIVPLTTVEKWAEVTLVGADEDYASAKMNFESIMSFEPSIIRLKPANNDLVISKLSGNGQIIIEYTTSFDPTTPQRMTYTSPNDEYVSFPYEEFKTVTIYGDVTKLDLNDEGFTTFSGIKVEGNSKLQTLVIADCVLEYLDVEKATELKTLILEYTRVSSLDLSPNKKLSSIQLGSTNAMMINLSGLQEVINLTMPNNDSCTTLLVNGANENVQNAAQQWITNTAAQNGNLYVDENTNQSLIVAAEAKDWDVTYVS